MEDHDLSGGPQVQAGSPKSLNIDREPSQDFVGGAVQPTPPEMKNGT